jgi:hypothetical protein
MNLLHSVVFFNGLYDIACGVNILFAEHTFLAQLHPTIFKKSYHDNDLVKRLIAYWILTYGIIRLSIIYHNPIVSLSYFIEAYAIAFEHFVYHTTVTHKALWTSSVSAILGLLLII